MGKMVKREGEDHFKIQRERKIVERNNVMTWEKLNLEFKIPHAVNFIFIQITVYLVGSMCHEIYFMFELVKICLFYGTRLLQKTLVR